MIAGSGRPRRSAFVPRACPGVWGRPRGTAASVARGAARRAQFFFDRRENAPPIGQAAPVAGGVQFVGLLFRQVAAGAAMLENEHSGNKVYIRLDEHESQIPPNVRIKVTEFLTGPAVTAVTWAPNYSDFVAIP